MDVVADYHNLGRRNDRNRQNASVLLKLISYLDLKTAAIASSSCSELSQLFKNVIIQRLRKYVLKDQGDLASLPTVLRQSQFLECLILDCRNRIAIEIDSASDSLTYITRNTLYDVHLSYLNRRERSNLKSLVLKGCTLLTTIGFQYIANNCNSLSALDLSNMPNLSASALIGVLLHNQNLTYICLEKSYNAVTDEVLKIIASVCRKVKTLSLSYCSLVTDTGIRYLSEYCHLLGELSLAHCYDVSALAVLDFEKLFNPLASSSPNPL